MRTEITLKGSPRTKKNSQVIIPTKSGKHIPLPSKDFRDYEKSCVKQLQGIESVTEHPVNVACVYYMPTHRRVDLTNLLEATDDILVMAGILEDDNSQVIASHDGSRVLYDKENPRVEIIITEAAE